MITITLIPGRLSRTGAAQGARPADQATATLDGVLYTAQSAHGASMVLARQLVAASCPDQAWEARNAKRQRTVYGNSLHALARTTIDANGRFIRWQPRPDGLHSDPQ